MIKTNFNFWKYSSPNTFYPVLNRLTVFFFILAFIATIVGLFIGLIYAPTDFQQGDVYRIIFIHVPSAWMSMFLYLMMAFWSIIGLVYKTKLSFMMAKAIAPTGLIMTFIALFTGSIWGKPTWGAWWVWDARLTSELILLFLYIGYISLSKSIRDFSKSDKVTGVLAIIGTINIPIIYFSVSWWNTLHQGASISFDRAPSMATSMLVGMLVMVGAFWTYSFAIILMRLKSIILERNQD